jgi:hypothetical protein
VRYTLVPLFLVAFITQQIWMLIPAIRAGFGDGRLGTFTAGDCDRSPKGVWTCDGVFQSDDQTVNASVTMYTSPQQLPASRQTRALYSGNNGWVYAPSGSRDWILGLFFVLLLVGGLVLWIVKIPVRDWQSRRPVPSGHPAPVAVSAGRPRAPRSYQGTRQRHRPRRR